MNLLFRLQPGRSATLLACATLTFLALPSTSCADATRFGAPGRPSVVRTPDRDNPGEETRPEVAPTRPQPQQGDKPHWWDSQVGMQEIVLPGYDPVRVEGTRLVLGARTYEWRQSYLPVRIDTVGGEIVGPMHLVVYKNGAALRSVPSGLSVVEKKPHHAVVVATGEVAPGLRLRVETRVEYDGLAMVEVELIPDAPTTIDGFDYTAAVSTNQWSNMIAFDEKTMNTRKAVLSQPPAYRGTFQNVLGFPDGERSFWWFAENAEGWIWNADTVTEVETTGDRAEIRQRLIGSRHTVEAPMRFQFNFLATPVRDPGSGWRKERIIPHAKEKELDLGTFHLWWIEALAHKDLPFTDYPEGARARIPEEDIKAYPGVAWNRQLIDMYENSWNLHRLPYFTAHSLSPLDPVIEQYRSEWERIPRSVNKMPAPPYDMHIEKPWMSLRSKSFINYVMYRIDRVVEELGMTGIYLDQGKPITSRNPAHGAWVDSNGKTRPSLDILGFREYVKRLRTLFHVRGKPGYVFTHSSAVEIVPAYTFVTGAVIGENFRGRIPLQNDDYISTVSLDHVRTLYAGNQSGVIMHWLPQIRYFHRGDLEWIKNDPQRPLAYRNLTTLALLHDIPIWPRHFPLNEYRKIVSALDRFGYDQAEFYGYWTDRMGVREDASNGELSLYVRGDGSAALLVVANLASGAQSIPVSLGSPGSLGLSGSGAFRARDAETGSTLPVDGSSRLAVEVPGKNFRLIQIQRLP